MRNFLLKVCNAMHIAWLSFKHPEIISDKNFKALVSLYALLFKTACTKTPNLVHVAFVSNIDTNDDTDALTVWCGYGRNCSPITRIEELRAENENLKKQLSDALESRIVLNVQENPKGDK